MTLLSQIHGPEDVKKLSAEECRLLATEIRQTIIDTVSRQGGHLASNLGDVELKIALHRVFSSPEDKLIFDVGHQVYTHKLLTGRQDRFETLRSYQGISGMGGSNVAESKGLLATVKGMYVDFAAFSLSHTYSKLSSNV